MLAWLGELIGRLIPDDLFDCWLDEDEDDLTLCREGCGRAVPCRHCPEVT